jgi:hypothetical protein
MPDAQIIEGIKLIRHNASGVNEPDDISLPWRLDASFSAPQLMVVAFAFLHGGTEEICVRGISQEALETFVEMNNLRAHPRLLQLTITEPERA